MKTLNTFHRMAVIVICEKSDTDCPFDILGVESYECLNDDCVPSRVGSEVPSTWVFNVGSFFDSLQCDCNCGAFDPDCVNEILPVSCASG